MRLAELSRRSAVSIATIKYYLRGGLLPPGERITATEADYGEHHVHRLRLIRALIGVGRLSVTATREILDAVTEDQDDPGPTLAAALNAASATQAGEQPAGGTPSVRPDTEGVADARGLIAEMEWRVPRDAQAISDLGRILDALTATGVDMGRHTMKPYARIADDISRLVSQRIYGPAGATPRAERTAVVTVLLEPALCALWRLALQDKSARRIGQESRTAR